ncbi:MAG: hypothetical protein IJO06_13420 [Thermoguttaceae bacterium]|nr:hypothetical protein [Thermoguttaceae bacterium]
MLAIVRNGGEIKTMEFPVDAETEKTLDYWALIEVVERDSVLYDPDEEGRFWRDDAIFGVAKSKIPGVAKKNPKEFQRFLVRWLEESDGWDEEDAALAASLVNKLDDWEEALNTLGYAVKTDVERRDYEELGRYYFGKWAERCDDGLSLQIETFVNYDALGEDCESDAYGYWCDIYDVWIDTEDCR